MLQLSSSCRYWLYRHNVDIRKGFDSLSGIVRNELNQNPLSGDVFIFINRRRTHIKLLVWDNDGFAIYYKRLEKGTYEIVTEGAGNAINVSSQQLMLLLAGISLKQVKYRRRYQHSEVICE